MPAAEKLMYCKPMYSFSGAARALPEKAPIFTTM